MIPSKYLYSGLRWFGWALICGIFRPDLLAQLRTGANASSIVSALVYYVVFGVAVELAYRRFAWGNLLTPPDLRDDSESPWKKWPEVTPDPDKPIVLRCADGRVRSGKKVGKVIQVEFLPSDRDQIMDDPSSLIPVEWRYYSLDREEKEEK